MIVTVQPSRIARYVAAQTWGNPVQSSKRLDAGIYRLDTPGHGGIVAVLGTAKLTAEGLAAARATGRIEHVAVVPNGRGHKLAGPSGYYREGKLAAWAAQYRGELVEVWIGEEDCEWSTVMLAATERARERDFAGCGDYALLDDPGRIAYCREVCERWHPDFLAQLDAQGVTA